MGSSHDEAGTVWVFLTLGILDALARVHSGGELLANSASFYSVENAASASGDAVCRGRPLAGRGWTGSTSLRSFPKTGPVVGGGPIVDIDDGRNGKTPAQRLADALALLSNNDRVIIRNDSDAPVRLARQIIRTTAWGREKQVFAYGTQRIKLDAADIPGQRVLRFNGAAREHWKGFEAVNCTPTPGSVAVVLVKESKFIKLEDWWVHDNPSPATPIVVQGGNDNIVQDCVIWHNGDGSTNSTLTGDGIALSNGTNSPTHIHIVRCYVANGNDDGIDLWAGTASEIVDCAVVGAGQYWNGRRSGDGIGFKMGGLNTAAGGNRVSGSIAVNNRAGGVDVNGARGATVASHVTGFGNGAAFGNIKFLTTSQGRVENAISAQGAMTHGNVNAGQDALASSVVESNNCWDVPFQTSKIQQCQSPQFADPGSGDFSLLPTSPYVGVGQGDGTLGASTVALQLLKDNWTRR